MEKQDAGGEVAPAISATVPIAAAIEMVAKARGETNAQSNQLPMLEQFHTKANFRKAVEKHSWQQEIDQLINGPMTKFAEAVWCGYCVVARRQILAYVGAPNT